MVTIRTSISSPQGDKGKEGATMKAPFRRGVFSSLLPLMALLAASALIFHGGTAEAGEKDGWLGVSLQRLTPELREAADISSDAGVLVTDVVEKSPAEKAGFEVGDIILKYDGEEVTSPRRLSKLVRKTSPNTKVKVDISRDGKKKTLTAEIGELDAEKACTIKIIGDKGKKELFLDFDDDLSLLGLPHLCSWLGSDLWLGVHTVDLTDQLAKYFEVKNGHGILISEVVSESPAEKAGLKAGDILIKANGERVEDTSDLQDVIADHEQGDEIELVVLRKGKEKKLKATLEERADHKKLRQELKEFPRKLKRMKIMAPSHDLQDIDVEVEKYLEDFDMEDLETRLEDLEEEMNRIKDKLEMK
jgi:predicted metalloprotease with PDZ domain